ncbi:MAG: phosphotransferase [Ahniella sp.]|nr:phosphotransferase [Ahniella sp.]
MCLHDAVVSFDPQHIRLLAHGHHDLDHPLRRVGGLSSVHLSEYGAQAMAVHGGLLARAEGRRAEPGLLVSLRGVNLFVTRLDDLPGPLETEAELVASTPTSWQYQFRIHHDGVLLGEGRAMVMLHA